MWYSYWCFIGLEGSGKRCRERKKEKDVLSDGPWRGSVGCKGTVVSCQADRFYVAVDGRLLPPITLSKTKFTFI